MLWRPFRRIVLTSALVLCIAVAQSAPRALGDEPAQPNPAIEILRGLDRASRLFLDATLRFSCKEEIVEEGPGTKRAFNFDYLYVYDESHGYQDYRTRGTKPPKPVDPDSVGVQQFLARASMWVLVFNHTRFDHHRYRLAGGDTMHGVPAVKVEFVPIPPYDELINDWFGTAWVDPESYQLLRVQAMRSADHRLWEQIQAGRGGAEQATVWITEVVTDFEVEKNGMRFPSRVTLTSRKYLPGMGPSRPLSEARSIQTYSDYRFYGVRTSEEVRSLLAQPPAPQAPPPPP